MVNLNRQTGERRTEGPEPSQPRLFDVLREAIRIRRYSLRTEDTYVDWVRRFILFHGKRHPRELGAPEVQAFLSHLAVERQVAASTQNQAKAALIFLYKEVLAVDLPWLGEQVARLRQGALGDQLRRLLSGEASAWRDPDPAIRWSGWIRTVEPAGWLGPSLELLARRAVDR